MKTDTRPRVYSYTRFSTKEQMKGDSERRQTEMIERALSEARRFAAEKGMVLDETLHMIDKGLSAHDGTHRTKGAFGKFLLKVEAGKVPRGSILLIENLDRLSREPFTTATPTILDLLNAGITIQTLSPSFAFTKESVNSGAANFLVMLMQTAHDESAKKSTRLKAAWEQKRRVASKANRLTARTPAWLTVEAKKDSLGRVIGYTELKVIPEAQETIQRIFKLKLEGFGKETIAKKLNESATWQPRDRKGTQPGWYDSYVEKILRNPAVIGEYQPHRLEDGKRVPVGEPIKGYFPAVISPSTFYAVQKRRKANKSLGGRVGKAFNVFRHLARCGYCGGPMVFVDKGDGGKYLICHTGKRGVRDEQKQEPVCRAHSVRYAEFEATVLDNCSKIKPELVLPTSKEQAAEVKRLRTVVDGLGAEHADIEPQISNLLEHIKQTNKPKMRTRYEQLIEELEARKTQLEVELAKAEEALRQRERGEKSFVEWQKNITGLKGAICKDADARIKLNTHLREILSHIEVFANGHEDTLEHAEALIEEGLPELERAPAYKLFRKYMRQRLLSPEGRCFRLHFNHQRQAPEPARTKSGRVYAVSKWLERVNNTGIQIAPPDSLADRRELTDKKQGKFHAPSIDKLLREFFDGRKPGFVPKASVRLNR